VLLPLVFHTFCPYPNVPRGAFFIFVFYFLKMNCTNDKALAHSPNYSAHRRRAELYDPQSSHKASDINDRMVADAERALIIPATCNHIHALVVKGAVLLSCVCIVRTDESCEQSFHIASKV